MFKKSISLRKFCVNFEPAFILLKLNYFNSVALEDDMKSEFHPKVKWLLIPFSIIIIYEINFSIYLSRKFLLDCLRSLKFIKNVSLKLRLKIKNISVPTRSNAHCYVPRISVELPKKKI